VKLLEQTVVFHLNNNPNITMCDRSTVSCLG